MSVPTELFDHAQWVCWRYETREGKETKVPVSPRTGRLASCSVPLTWADATTACAYANGHGLGVGFVFSAGDPFAGVDLDRCVGEDGALAEWAAEIVAALDSYAERSPSGTGIKVLVRAALPPGRRSWGDGHGMYDRGRFFTLTGERLPGTPSTINERHEAVAALHARLFPPAVPGAAAPPTALHLLDDHEVIRRAMGAANGRKFADLFLDHGHGYPSESEADAALCALLAFWVGADGGRVDRLFRLSRRYRAKWERASYRDKTIALALSRQEYYRPGGGARRSTPLVLGGRAG